MDTPGDRLRWAREQKGKYSSATEAAEARGWNASTYRTHENGQRNFSKDTAKVYAKAFGVTWLWLMEGDDQPSLLPQSMVMGGGGPGRAAVRPSIRKAEPASPKTVPIKGDVAAGLWLDLDAEQDYRSFEPYIIVADPTYPANAQYGLIVRGTSMNKVAPEGTVLHCLDLGIAGVQPEENDIVIVERRRSDQREVTAKRIRREGDTVILSPDSTEEKWKPIRFNTAKPTEEVAVSVVALVIGFYQSLRGRRLA